MIERRAAYRFPVALKAQVAAEGQLHDATVINVSRTGLCLRDVPTRAERVGITLRLSESTLTLSGHVVRDSGEGIGVRFDDLDRSVQHELANYVLARNYTAQSVSPRA